MSVSLRALSAACGAEVIGLDVKQRLDEKTIAELHRALAENCILLFRDCDVSPEEHIAFSGLFGPLETHVVGEFNLPGHPRSSSCRT